MAKIKKFDKTLGIFTVKKISYYGGQYYTYGGFGTYLTEIRKYFRKTVLVAHVKNEIPPQGHYRIERSRQDLFVIHLLQSRNELENLLQLPYNFCVSLGAVRKMDIVHARMPDYTGIMGAVGCKIYAIPYFVQIIADWFIEGKKMPASKKGGLGLLLKLDYFVYDVLERLMCRNQLVFAQGHTSYKKHRTKADANIVASTAHHRSDLCETRPRFRGKRYRLLNVARMTGIKNQKLIISALVELNNQMPGKWSLDFVGEGPLLRELLDFADQNGVGHIVSFHGQVDRGKVLWEFYDAADAFVLSSRSEGTPKVILEAMARSLPVVASNVGGIPFLAPDMKRGLLFQDNSVKALVLSILRLYHDSELREKLVLNGKRFAMENTIENTTTYMIDKVKKRWGLK